MMLKLASIAVTLLLVTSCRPAGPPAMEPVVRLVTPPPCLLAPPNDPGPILLAAPLCEGAGESRTCPALTDHQLNALWAYALALEGYAGDAWTACGPRAGSGDRAGAGGGGAGGGSPP
jgi:hypothetical protein